MNPNTKTNLKPFLKWAGGKTQLLPDIDRNLPREQLIDGTITKYVEPFVGSGAVLFFIMNTYPQLKEAFIYDVNPELINVYKSVQNNVDDLIEVLKVMELNYLKSDIDTRKRIYYDTRESFNKGLNKLIGTNLSKKHITERAAQFIFLNRTCFNGLFRVNRRGEFNVPMGQYKNPTICNEAVLKATNVFLERVNINLGDYRESEEVIDNSTFVYFDPPYKPVSKSSSFTAYSKNDFDDSNQVELRDYFNKLHHEKKAFLMLSNSDPKDIEDGNFFDNLYKNDNAYGDDIYVQRVFASRRINSKASNRGEITELLITNYNKNMESSNATNKQ